MIWILFVFVFLAITLGIIMSWAGTGFLPIGLLILSAIAFAIYASWAGMGVAPVFMICIGLICVVGFCMIFANTAFVIPVIIPLFLFFVLICLSPILGLCVIPLSLVVLMTLPMMTLPYISFLTIILSMVIISGIFLTLFGSPLIGMVLL